MQDETLEDRQQNRTQENDILELAETMDEEPERPFHFWRLLETAELEQAALVPDDVARCNHPRRRRPRKRKRLR